MNNFSLQIVSICFIIYLVFTMTKLEKGLKLIDAIHQYGYEAYIVGGAVRDYILNRPIHDVDICTNALPLELEALFSLSQMNLAYLNCSIKWLDETFEVTTYRKDLAYQDHRHPEAIQATNLKEDILRRDFTMNGLVMDSDYQIIDYCNGRADIEQHIIRTIGDAKKRFEEDGLRILRAIEFSSRLDFSLDDTILESLKKDYVGQLAEEYINSMLDKMLKNPFLNRLDVIKKYQVLRSFPFYQVAIEEALPFSERNIYALFYAKHGFLPTHTKLSKKVLKEATWIGELARSSFSRMMMFNAEYEDCLEALRIYNHLYQPKHHFDWLFDEYNKLPIHHVKDIDFNFNCLPNKNRSIAQKCVLKAILNEKLENKSEQILNYIENEGLTV